MLKPPTARSAIVLQPATAASSSKSRREYGFVGVWRASVFQASSAHGS